MTGVGALLGQRLRRDGVQLSLWSVGTALLAFLAFTGVSESYGTAQDRSSLLAAAIANPVILVFRGLPSGSGEGAFIAFLIIPWLCLLAAFMSSFLAVRHTRGDEETGRAELVAATPAARRTPLIATVVHGCVANIVLAAFTALAFMAAGLEARGSVVSGAAAGGVGLVFFGVGLVAGQLMRTARGANALSIWVLLAAFVTAGIGNALGTPSNDLQRVESSWLTWLSPFGWAENTRPFDADNGWPLALTLLVAVALVGTAAILHGVRDLGESFVAERSGRRDASVGLIGAGTLTWRLSRGAIVGWAVGGLAIGAMSTSLASIVAEIGATNPAVQQILAQISGSGDIEQGTVTVFFTMLGVLAACAAVQTVCRARQEEAHGTAESVLATPVHRVRWLAGYLAVALAAILVVALAGGVGAGLGIAARGGDLALMRDVAVVGGGQVAAASVFAVVTALVFVLIPRATIPLGWSLVLVGTVLGLFGPLFGFPEWLSNLSPVGVAPLIDGDAFDPRGLWWLLGVASVGTAGALALMRRRELAADG